MRFTVEARELSRYAVLSRQAKVLTRRAQLTRRAVLSRRVVLSRRAMLTRRSVLSSRTVCSLFKMLNTQNYFLVNNFAVNDYISNLKIGLARIYDTHNEAHFSKE